MSSPPPFPADEDTRFYRAALHEVISLATDLARRIHAAATVPAGAGDAPALSLEAASVALDRTARTLRRSVLLARRLNEPPPAPDRSAGRRQVIRAVEDAIHRAARDTPDRRDALDAELAERLDRPEFEHDLLTRPVAELIEELARDLGVATQGRSFVFRRRTPADIARLVTRAGTPGRPAPGPPDRPGNRHLSVTAGSDPPP